MKISGTVRVAAALLALVAGCGGSVAAVSEAGLPSFDDASIAEVGGPDGLPGTDSIAIEAAADAVEEDVAAVDGAALCAEWSESGYVCTECWGRQCCAQAVGCFGAEACNAYLECAQQCVYTDAGICDAHCPHPEAGQDCVGWCQATYEAGYSDYQTFYACVKQNCPAGCWQ